MDAAKNVLNDKQISEALIANGITKLADKDELLVLHDGSDIRKKYAKELEDIGKVRDLDGHIISGYNSFNSVAVDLHGKSVTPLATEIYSNGSEDFISQKDLKLISKPLSKKATEAQRLHYEEIQEKAKNLDYLNHTLVAKSQIKHLSEQLKKGNPLQKLTHVIDRGSDDNNLFNFIKNELCDQFVIRMKSSRLSESKEKLSDKKFAHQDIRVFDKIQIKNRVYQHARCIIEYGESLNGYSVIRVKLIDRKGMPIFKQPMLLITSKKVSTSSEASNIYHIYLKRSDNCPNFFYSQILGIYKQIIVNTTIE